MVIFHSYVSYYQRVMSVNVGSELSTLGEFDHDRDHIVTDAEIAGPSSPTVQPDLCSKIHDLQHHDVMISSAAMVAEDALGHVPCGFSIAIQHTLDILIFFRKN